MTIPMNLPPAATPWGRDVSRRTASLDSNVEQLNQAVRSLDNTVTGGASIRAASTITNSIADNATTTGTINFSRAGALLEYMIDGNAHIRIYGRQTDIAADSSRGKGQYPAPGVSLVFESWGTQASLIPIVGENGMGAPFANLDIPPTGNLHYWIRNESGDTRPFHLTFRWIQ